MNRSWNAVFTTVLVLLFPLALVSQSSDSNRTGASTVLAKGGCSSFLSELAGGGGAASGGADDKAVHGYDPANLDRSISPCDDFYKFADGGWIKNNPVPADRPSWARYNKLRNDNEDVLHQILDEASKNPKAEPSADWRKIGDFYASCMDESQVEAAGVKPLASEFQRIGDVKDIATLQDEIARLQSMGVNAVFNFGSEQDLKDSTKVIAGAGQAGLGLPDRQYYLDDDDHSKQLRAGYLQHMTNMFKLMGDDAAASAAEAKTVLDLETSLAKASRKREDLRDPTSNYHPMDLTQLDELTPHLSWASFFKGIGAPPLKSADIGQPDFFKQVDAALVSVPLADWKTYLRWHLIHTAAPALSAKFVDENFDFYGRALTGVKQQLPRFRRCVEAADAKLGEALGQYYVKRNFPPEAKAQALAMVRNIVAALRDDLSTLDWMSPETRVQAIKKLDALTLKIGYPDKWRDYSAYRVDRGPYVENALRGNQFENARDLGKIGKPVDLAEWIMTPQTVNAYYAAARNEIVFPAGILQPPFFDPKSDDAINYGGIGSVMGHEMTHGFDDQGAKFDGRGNLSNWWTPEDLKNFQQRGECIVQQFDASEIEPGLNGNGKLEEGEAIADLGGITISHAAFLKTLGGKSSAPIDGFTPDQRFFLGWAQMYAANITPEFARLIAKTDPHPIDRIRVNAPLTNIPAFAKAFSCPADSKMVRPEGQRCRIW